MRGAETNGSVLAFFGHDPIFERVLIGRLQEEDAKSAGVMVGKNMKSFRMPRQIKRLPFTLEVVGRGWLTPEVRYQ